MITLYTNDIKIEIAADNPIYNELLPLDGRFVGVTVTQQAVKEEPPKKIEETEYVTVDGEAYFKELDDAFGENSVAHHLLLSNVSRFLTNGNQTSNVKVTKQVVNSNYRIASDSSGYLLAIPTRLLK